MLWKIEFLNQDAKLLLYFRHKLTSRNIFAVYCYFHREDNLTLPIFYHFNNLSETCLRSSAYIKLVPIIVTGECPLFDYEVLEIQELYRLRLSFILQRKEKTIRSETSLRYFGEMQSFDIIY